MTHLTPGEVVSALLVLCAPAASEGEPVLLVSVSDGDAEVLALVALPHIPIPPHVWPSMVVILVIAVEPGPWGDGRGLTAEVLAVAHVLLAHADRGVIVTLAVMTMIEALTMKTVTTNILTLTLSPCSSRVWSTPC